MKQLGKIVIFWSGMIVATSLFMLVFLWSIIPFGGATLPHVLEQLWNMAFHSSALLVSLTCGLLAVGAISLTLLNPVSYSNDNMEECSNET